MLYIQLNKDGVVLDILRRLKRNYGKICLSGAIIDRVGNIPDHYNNLNVVKVMLTCSLLKLLGKKYSEYQMVLYEYTFNSISYDNDTAGNIIKALVDMMVDD